MDARVSMGENFRNVRKEVGFTQEQIAKNIGVDRSLIAKFEKGERNIGIAALERACELFGCSMNVLRGKEEFVPMKIAFRASDLEADDIEAIRNIQKLLLNMRKMKELGRD